MQNFHVSAKTGQQSAKGHSFRFHPAVHLNTGDLVGAFVDLPFAFDDRPVFNLAEKRPSVASWMADVLSGLCHAAVSEDLRERPLILPMPAAALSTANVVSKCADVMAGSRLCPQEICFEVTDATLTACPSDVATIFRNFRQRGFRIAVDAGRSSAANLKASTWLMVDTLRIGTDNGDIGDDLLNLVDTASAAGVAIIVEDAYWRDGEYLASLGIEYGLNPRVDA